MKQMYCKEHRLAVTSSLTGAILSAQINLLCKVSNCLLDTLINLLKRHNYIFSFNLSDLEDGLELLNEDLTLGDDDSDSDDSAFQPVLVEICNLKF